MTHTANYPIHCKSYKNATLMATVVDRKNKTFTGGVFDSSGNVIVDSLRQDPDHLGPQPFPQTCIYEDIKSKIASPEILKGNYLYLGSYTYHYGHFLLESLSRTWALKNDKFDGYIFSEFVIQSEQLKTYTKELLSRAGVEPEKTIIVKNNVIIESLHVPTPLFYIGNKAHPKYIETYSSISKPQEKGALKIYLSRSMISKRKRKVVNEKAIEQAFIEHGFIIVHPEKISIDAQLEIYRNCHILASLDGSALHNGLFLPRKSRIINICTLRYPNKLNKNQSICNQLNELTCDIIPFEGDIVDSEKQTTRFHVPAIRRWLRRNLQP